MGQLGDLKKLRDTIQDKTIFRS